MLLLIKISKKIKKILNIKNIFYIVVTGFGSGLLFPKFSGTFGTFIAIFFWILMTKIFSTFTIWIVIIIGFFIGCIFCKQNNIKIHDHYSIVFDEFIGIWITLMSIPSIEFKWIFIAFFVFRVFDILKPWPICFFDKKVINGFGIMIDDIIAAIFSCVIIYIYNNILLIF
ncbi:Phosphatidylglycerophosphatase A [Candidatus Providencia siddallii]|uniref:Phosphatidylglycerophosphatase A n=1 Tax=Candidatus Providencia siddallii TaxID=1715285 RepID=A0ABP1CHE9_9GAMM